MLRRCALPLAALMATTAAHADLSISSKPTQNMSCDAGVCTATAQKAVLNVGDLQTMLASGDVVVKTGMFAKDIEIDQPLTWATTSRLTLDAQASVTVNKQVTVSGTGNLTIVTNDGGGKTGEFIIVPEHGSVQFWDLASSLIIDGNSYMLVGDIKTLADDIAANASGFYALAKSYDASEDGTYTSSPIPTTFVGNFEGLGNQFVNLTIKFASDDQGLFRRIDTKGTASNVCVLNADLMGTMVDGGYGGTGLLAGANYGTVRGACASGVISLPEGTNELAGGLVGDNRGTITRSHTSTEIAAEGVFGIAGGIASLNEGTITQSFSKGKLKAASGNYSPGGIVGYNAGKVENTYSLAKVNQNGNCCGGGYYGGLVGKNEPGGTILSSYAAGKTGSTKRSGATGGGLIGFDASDAGSISSTYWDLDTGVSDPNHGTGNIPNDPGITGLTGAQLKSGLPAGFDPKVWGSNRKINRGYPYLLANPSQ